MTKDANASFSRLELYSNCPRQYQYKYIDKLQEEPRPQQLDRHGNAKLAAHERGSILHEAADDFINSRVDTLHKELKNLAPELRAAREIKSETPDRVSTEQKWYSNDMWIPCTPPEKGEGYHLITIIDLLIFDEYDPTSAQAIDFKSGKRYGNELKHQRQLQLYALAAFERYPELNSISAELWYIDLGLIHKQHYNRAKILAQKNYWNSRINDMRDDTTYEPNANKSSCKFCAYGAKEHSNKWVNKSGHCKYSTED